ncbi:MAG: phenylacetate--CoA ligase [Firmicutes bacterium]|jgi:phenylacetate-CoA ligase|nr:phenylacetate--CoA ligase [Bacillota bacterium]
MNVWNPVLETMPPEDLRRYQLIKFKEQCIYAFKNSPYYMRKFTEAGLKLKDLENIKTMDDVLKIPISSKKEFAAAQEGKEPFPYGELLAVPIERISEYHQTSGTTGTPLRWGDTWADWEWYADIWATILYSRGLRAKDRLYIAFPYHIYIAFWGGHYGAEKIGAEVIPGGSTGTEERIREIVELRCTALMCTPSYALHMVNIAKQMDIDLRKTAVSKLFCTGEPGASIISTKQRIEEAWGAKVFDHVGATEAPLWSFQCEEQRGLHLNEAHYLVEILNPETLTPVAEGETGTVVVTNFARKGMPTIRYDLKDLIKISSEKCPCGRTWRMSEGGVAGRRDEMSKVRGVLFSPKNVEKAVMSIPELNGEFKIIITREKDYDSVMVKAEAFKDYENIRAELAERLSKELRNTTTLRCDVEILPSGTLPRHEAKAKRLEDLR